MYVSTYNKDMPCGLGIEWKLEKGGFSKNLMTDQSISMGSIEWIDFMNNDPRFIDSSGKRQFIQSGWTGIEIKIGTYPVDGYVKVDDQIYALQFDGCFWVIINFNKVQTLPK